MSDTHTHRCRGCALALSAPSKPLTGVGFRGPHKAVPDSTGYGAPWWIYVEPDVWYHSLRTDLNSTEQAVRSPYCGPVVAIAEWDDVEMTDDALFGLIRAALDTRLGRERADRLMTHLEREQRRFPQWTTAYVVAFWERQESTVSPLLAAGAYVLRGLRVTSEFPLSGIASEGQLTTLVHSAQGKDYQDARDNAVAELRRFFPWLPGPT